jgi:hypothetical protein
MVFVRAEVRRCAGLEGVRLYGLRHSFASTGAGASSEVANRRIFVPFRITFARQPLEDAGSIHSATNFVRDTWLRMGWTPTNVCPKVMGRGGVRVQFTVGLKLKGKTDHVAVDAEDALIAALKVKTEYPEAVITYVRQQNRRGDARHPSHGLSEDKHRGTIPAGDQLRRKI